MLASVLVEPGLIELREVECPHPKAGDVIVKVHRALTSGTDLKAFRRGHPLMPMPTLFGHEFSGEVAAIGSDVTRFHEGDPVMAVHTAPCGRCELCRRGHSNLCEMAMKTKVLGAYAKYIRIPAHIAQCNMFNKPDHLSYGEAAMLQSLACVVHGLNLVCVHPDDRVLIIGAGAIGLLYLMVLQAQGIEQIIVSGHRSYRLNLARQLGARVIIDAEQENARQRVMEETAGRGAHLVIECTGQPSVWEMAVEMVSRSGTVVLFGGCPKGTTVTFDTGRLHYDEITLKGAFHFTPATVRQAYQLLLEKKIDVQPLLTGEYPLHDLPHVFELLMEGNCIKYAIVP